MNALVLQRSGLFSGRRRRPAQPGNPLSELDPSFGPEQLEEMIRADDPRLERISAPPVVGIPRWTIAEGTKLYAPDGRGGTQSWQPVIEAMLYSDVLAFEALFFSSDREHLPQRELARFLESLCKSANRRTEAKIGADVGPIYRTADGRPSQPLEPERIFAELRARL